MRGLSPELMLRAWEHGQRRHPIDRAVMLHALATPETAPERLADESLGRRNAALLRLRQATFGGRLGAYLDCPACGERLELEAAAEELLAACVDRPEPVEVEGLSFRQPTSRDLATILGAADADQAHLRLLRSCLLDDRPELDDAQLAAVAERVETALEAADPGADITFDLCCAGCGREWRAPFDVAAFVWEEIEAAAGRLLDAVHVLAAAYGWSEREILALSEARRAAYLARVSP